MTEPRHSGPWWSRTVVTIAVEQMAHRPPLPRRWIAYCVAAYLIPVIALGALPEELGTVREVSWLTTLAPAFIFSLHFGMLGALAGLIAGTVLYAAVQLIFGLQLVEVNQDVLLPIYVSYGMLAIAVGWLSQQLHDYYGRLLRAERLAAIGEVAITLQHELNNALQAISAEAGALHAGRGLDDHGREGVTTILDMTRRIQQNLQKLTTMTSAPTTAYVGRTKMVELPS